VIGVTIKWQGKNSAKSQHLFLEKIPMPSPGTKFKVGDLVIVQNCEVEKYNSFVGPIIKVLESHTLFTHQWYRIQTDASYFLLGDNIIDFKEDELELFLLGLVTP
jgi:hypothetical protein